MSTRAPKPSAVELPELDGDLALNMAGVIRFLWDLDLDVCHNPELVTRVRAWRQRIEIVRHACAILATPPTLDELLWEHGNGAELERRINAVPLEPGQRKFTTDFDLFDVILGDTGEEH